MSALRWCIGLLALLTCDLATAQELEPRRWTYLPMDARILTVGVAQSNLDILFDPVLDIEEAEQDVQTYFASYSHNFSLAGKSSRIDVILPYQRSRWDGLLRGDPASVRRTGLKDPTRRWSVLLLGAPALSGKEYM